MLYKVSEFVLFIYLFYILWFRFQEAFLVRLLTLIFFFSLYSFCRLFGARQSTARVLLAHVVMSSPASAKTVPLEPNVLIANEVDDAVEVDDTDHVEFAVDELKEQLGIDSVLEKLNDLAAKFCGGKTRTCLLYTSPSPRDA